MFLQTVFTSIEEGGEAEGTQDRGLSRLLSLVRRLPHGAGCASEGGVLLSRGKDEDGTAPFWAETAPTLTFFGLYVLCLYFFSCPCFLCDMHACVS